MTTSVGTSMRTGFLLCGVAAAMLYVGGDIAAALRYPGYSYTSQAVSELMAIDAPTRPLLVTVFSAYDALALAFGIGVWRVAHGRRALRVVGALLMAWTAVGFVGLVFTPMHMRGAGPTLTDTLHIVNAAVLVALILLSMGFAAAALGKGFRRYSIVTMALLLVFGGLTGMQGPRIDANLPTPWMGATERVNIYATMLWMLVLAVMLIRERADTR